jgi:hypothetical protein
MLPVQTVHSSPQGTIFVAFCRYAPDLYINLTFSYLSYTLR